MSLRPDGARQSVTAGKRNRRITVMRYSINRNEDNEPIEAWTELASVWASLEYASDGEKVRAGQVGAVVGVRFSIAYSPAIADVNAKDKVEYDGQTFDIHGVKELGHREGIEISAAAPSDE